MTPLFVIVVDDTDLYRLTESRMLKAQGCDVATAENGQAAVDIVRSSNRRPSLVLMDHSMPVMNGSDVTKLIKQFDSGIPVVGLTCERDSAVLTNFMESGLSGIYDKPVSLSDMKEIVRKHSL